MQATEHKIETEDFSVDSAPVHMSGPGEPRDVRFISDLIDKLEAEYSIDPNRIYADGMSIGGDMAFALSCELSDRIAAVGAVSAAQL